MADPEKLSAFVQWCRQHITGDEEGEAQIFLDCLFQDYNQRDRTNTRAGFISMTLLR